jgi:NAD-dependent dihydropyrimidine dehydrogenase PreA subunit
MRSFILILLLIIIPALFSCQDAYYHIERHEIRIIPIADPDPSSVCHFDPSDFQTTYTSLIRTSADGSGNFSQAANSTPFSLPPDGIRTDAVSGDNMRGSLYLLSTLCSECCYDYCNNGNLGKPEYTGSWVDEGIGLTKFYVVMRFRHCWSCLSCSNGPISY